MSGKSENAVNKIDQEKKLCFRCSEPHDAETCKFASYTCSYCKKVGHLSKTCFKKKNASNKKKPTAFKSQAASLAGQCNTMVEEESEADNLYDLNTVSYAKCPDKIMIHLKLNNKPMMMEVDFSASCTIMNEEKWLQIRKRNQNFRSTKVKLQTWLKHNLIVCCEVDIDVEYGNKVKKLPLLVVKGAGGSLMGRNWFDALGVHVHNIGESTLNDLIKRYKDIFNDELGAHKGYRVSVELEADAKPIFRKFRQVPIAIRNAVG